MQPRKPIYRDLLTYVKINELKIFMRGLTTRLALKKLPITPLTEVDHPIYCKQKYYHSALCYAVTHNDYEMTKALLKIGANPNVADLNTPDGSALSIASQYNPNMLQILLAAPNLELYTINAKGRSAFFSSDCSTTFVLSLLAFDPLVSGLGEDEKLGMSNVIVEAIKSKSTYQTNTAICKMLKTVYVNEEDQKLVANEIKDACPFITSGQPIGDMILSYLFVPKPHSLKVMENWVLHNEPQPEVEEQTIPQCPII